MVLKGNTGKHGATVMHPKSTTVPSQSVLVNYQLLFLNDRQPQSTIIGHFSIELTLKNSKTSVIVQVRTANIQCLFCT